MAKSILGPIDDRNLYRLHLWGGGSQASSGGGTMDEYIGRTAHVRHLEYFVQHTLHCAVCLGGFVTLCRRAARGLW